MKSALAKYLLFMLLCCTALISYGQHIRSVPDSVANKMKGEEPFKYANDPSFWAKEKPGSDLAVLRLLASLLQSSILRWTLYVLLAAVLMYVIYKVIASNSLFAASPKRPKKDKGSGGDSEIPPNIEAQLAAAIAAGQFRLAVRFHFLRTLSLLDKGAKIKLHAKSTNHDYLQQMKAYAGGDNFRKLTRIYEYVWYGEFTPDAVQFERISSGFNEFNKTI